MNTLRKNVIKYWLVGFWIVFFSVNSLLTCAIAASSGCVWETLDMQSKLTVIAGIFANWTLTMMAFMSKVAAQTHIELPGSSSGTVETVTTTQTSKTP